MPELAKLKLDSKKRLSLGKLVDENVTGFNAYRESDGRIILEPTVDIPTREAWLYQNQEALASVRQGLSDSKHRRTSKLDLSTLAADEED